MFDRTSNPFATPPATASTLGPHTQSTRIPVRTFQQPRTLGQIPSPSRSQSPTKRFNQPSHESSTPMSPSKHKIHRSSAQESVSSTSIQAKSRDQSPSKQTSPSRRPPLFPWWVDSGARVPPMNMSRPGSPVRRGFTTVTSIDVQAAADGVLEYWVERAGAGRRAELRARLVQECPEMVHAAEDRWHEAQLGEGEVD